jgi:hypothetical protein
VAGTVVVVVTGGFVVDVVTGTVVVVVTCGFVVDVVTGTVVVVVGGTFVVDVVTGTVVVVVTGGFVVDVVTGTVVVVVSGTVVVVALPANVSGWMKKASITLGSPVRPARITRSHGVDGSQVSEPANELALNHPTDPEPTANDWSPDEVAALNGSGPSL